MIWVGFCQPDPYDHMMDPDPENDTPDPDSKHCTKEN